jgi:hypothetical protein
VAASAWVAPGSAEGDAPRVSVDEYLGVRFMPMVDRRLVDSM